MHPLFCPAKINLGLQVHHRRPHDGYHYISSIFIPISFGDQLLVRTGLDIDALKSKLKLEGAARADYLAVSESGELQKNIIWQVLQKTLHWRRKNGSLSGVHVHVTKQIPTGGGLGGGSSNAGRLLAFLQKQYGIPESEIQKIALECGADVPFFLQSDPALVSGIGEQIRAIAIGSGWGVLAIPAISVNTQRAYQMLKRTLQATPPPESIRGLDTNARLALRESRWHDLGGLRNDFEEPVFELHPELKSIKDEFERNEASLTMLSGSGSCVYALVASESRAAQLVLDMRSSVKSCRFVPFGFEAGYDS